MDLLMDLAASQGTDPRASQDARRPSAHGQHDHGDTGEDNVPGAAPPRGGARRAGASASGGAAAAKPSGSAGGQVVPITASCTLSRKPAQPRS